MKPVTLNLPLAILAGIGIALANAVLLAFYAVRGVLRWPEPARLMALIVAVVALGMLSGCLATVNGFRAEQMPNKLTMTTACDEVRMDSGWLGLFGISSGIRPQDAKPVLDALCGGKAAAVAVPPAAPASAAK